MRFRIIPLEERILLDAAAMGDVAHMAHHQQEEHARAAAQVGMHTNSHDNPIAERDAQHPNADPGNNTHSSDHSHDNLIVAPPDPTAAPGVRVLVVSSEVTNATALEQAALGNVKVVTYDASNTSLQSLTQDIAHALNGQKAASIAFAGNGQNGTFALTDQVDVNLSNLQGNHQLQKFWEHVGSMVQNGGSIDILAGDVAGHGQGNALLGYLNSLVDQHGNVQLNAANSVMGNAEWGGGWSLEYGAGVNAEQLYFNPHELNAWSGTLDTLPYMVSDINSGSGHSTPTDFATVNGTVFFTATNGSHGTELWKSDGTNGGTVMVKNIDFGSTTSNPGNLINVGGTLFFTVNDGSHGTELWKSDGTSSGTVMVADISTGSADASATALTNVNGTLFFAANDGTHGMQVWKSDGTTAGTVMVTDINDGTGANPANFTLMNNVLYFTTTDSTHGNELWRTDGTTAGTSLVDDISPGASSSSITNMITFNNHLYFGSINSGSGDGLWVSDGTAAGTTLPSSALSNPTNLTESGGQLFFTATTSHGVELCKTDGTPPGTVQVADINPEAPARHQLTSRMRAGFSISVQIMEPMALNFGEATAQRREPTWFRILSRDPLPAISPTWFTPAGSSIFRQRTELTVRKSGEATVHQPELIVLLISRAARTTPIPDSLYQTVSSISPPTMAPQVMNFGRFLSIKPLSLVRTGL